MMTKENQEISGLSHSWQNFLNIVPIVCALMVVLIHQYAVADPTSTTVSARIIGFLSHGICTAAVPVFFFLSGYLFYRNITEIGDVFRKQKKRVRSVLIPFLAWSATYYLVFFVLSKVLPNEIERVVDVSPWGVIRGIVFYEYIFPMWYMFQLCVFILLAPVIFYILQNRIVSILMLIASAVIGMFVIDSISIHIGSDNRALFHFNFFAYYLLGCVLARETMAFEKIQSFVNKMPLFIPIILVIVFGFVESLFFDRVIVWFNDRCFVPFVFVAFVWMMMKWCGYAKKTPKIPVSTMILYGAHSLVGLVLGQLILGRLRLPLLIHYAVSFIAVTIVSLGIGYVLKFIKPLYRLYSGNR